MNGYSHQNTYGSKHKDNVYMNYTLPWPELEIVNKLNFIFNLSTKLVKEKNYKGNLNIRFIDNYFSSDTNLVFVDYDKSYFINYEKEYNENDFEKYLDRGIVITIYYADIVNVESMLKIVSSSIDNVYDIKNNTSRYIFKRKYRENSDTVKSIAYKKIIEFINKSDSTVDKISNTTLVSDNFLVNNNTGIGYFYRNHKYHFNLRGNLLVTKPFLVTDDVFEITGNSGYGEFIFISHNTFYYRHLYDQKISGPYMIENLKKSRPNIRFFKYSNEPFRNIEILFDTYGSNRRILFFPDKKVIISNYDSLQRNWLESLINNSNKKYEEKTDEKYFIYFSIALIAMIIFTIILKRKKNTT